MAKKKKTDYYKYLMTADHIIDQCRVSCQYGDVDKEMADDLAYEAFKKIIMLLEENDMIKCKKGFDDLRMHYAKNE